MSCLLPAHMEIDETAIAAAAYAAAHSRSEGYNILAVALAMACQVCPPLSRVAIERRRGTILGSSRLASSTVMGDVDVGRPEDRESKGESMDRDIGAIGSQSSDSMIKSMSTMKKTNDDGNEMKIAGKMKDLGVVQSFDGPSMMNEDGEGLPAGGFIGNYSKELSPGGN